jgi:hypothetical protein
MRVSPHFWMPPMVSSTNTASSAVLPIKAPQTPFLLDLLG